MDGGKDELSCPVMRIAPLILIIILTVNYQKFTKILFIKFRLIQSDIRDHDVPHSSQRFVLAPHL